MRVRRSHRGTMAVLRFKQYCVANNYYRYTARGCCTQRAYINCIPVNAEAVDDDRELINYCTTRVYTNNTTILHVGTPITIGRSCHNNMRVCVVIYYVRVNGRAHA